MISLLDIPNMIITVKSIVITHLYSAFFKDKIIRHAQ